MTQIFNWSHLPMSKKRERTELLREMGEKRIDGLRGRMKHDKSEGVTVQSEREFLWFHERFRYVDWHLAAAEGDWSRPGFDEEFDGAWERNGADGHWDVSSDVIHYLLRTFSGLLESTNYASPLPFSRSFSASPSIDSCHIWSHWHTSLCTKRQVSTYKLRQERSTEPLFHPWVNIEVQYWQLHVNLRWRNTLNSNQSRSCESIEWKDIWRHEVVFSNIHSMSPIDRQKKEKENINEPVQFLDERRE